MSPTMCIVSFMDPIQLSCPVSGEGGTISATGLPKRVTRRGFLVWRTCSSRARHLALNSEMATSFTDLLNHTNAPWSNILVILPECQRNTSFCDKLRQPAKQPVGTVEEVLVEKIAQEYWRLGAAAWHEAEALSMSKPFAKTPIDRILRYQSTINRQLYQAINQPERLQRLRKGDNVPAPLNLQVLRDTPTISEEDNSEQ